MEQMAKCDECDCSFPCWKGAERCIREPEPAGAGRGNVVYVTDRSGEYLAQPKEYPGTVMFAEACSRVIRASVGKGGNWPYAAAYAYQARRDLSLAGVRDAAPDLLANLGQWAGDEAREVKRILRMFL
jgi:hypothetical protein